MITLGAAAMPPSTQAQTALASRLRAALSVASQEMVTGQKADAGAALGGDFSFRAGLDHALARTTAYQTVVHSAGLMGEAMQSTLGQMTAIAQRVSADLTRLSSSASSFELSALLPANGFEDAINALRGKISGRAIFGGTDSDMAPLPPASTLLNALEATLSGLSDPGDLHQAIRDFFTGPNGYETLYAGGAARGALAISPDATAILDFTALDPAFRQTLAGLASLALMERGLLANDGPAQSALARSALGDLLSAEDHRILLAGRIGVQQGKLDQAKARNASEFGALTLLRQSTTEVDQYEAAVRLKDIENQLDSFYTLLARLSKMSLTNYL